MNPTMSPKKQYFAFISYSHKDSEMAKWLQHEFEYYELPSTLSWRKDLPESFRPVFRDEDELSGGELKTQICDALVNSEYLIVVCSPNSARSVYVDSEIQYFIQLSPENKRRIFPFIIDGKPHQQEEQKEYECFPKTILELSEDEDDPIELIAGDIKATGRDHAFVKILAGTLREKNVQFAELWDRYAIEKAEKERKEREDKERLQIAHTRFVTEKANSLIDDGDSLLARRLSIEFLPDNLKQPNRPYTPEAESLLRKSYSCNCCLFASHDSIESAKYSPDGKHILASLPDYAYMIWDVANGECICKNLNKVFAHYATYSEDGKRIATSDIVDGEIQIWDSKTNRLLQRINTGLKTEDTHIRRFEFRNNDRELIIVPDNGRVRLWDIQEGRMTKEFGYSSPIGYDMAICCQKGLYCHHNYDNHVVVEDCSGEIIFKTEDQYKFISCLSVSDDGSIMGYVTDNELFIWDIQNTRLLIRQDGIVGPVVSIVFNTEHSIVAMAYFNEKKRGIDLWDYARWERIYHIKEDVDRDSFIEFGKDGKTILLCNPRNHFVKQYIYGLNNRPKLFKTRDALLSAGFDRSKRMMATADKKGDVIIWDLETNKKLFSFDTHLRHVYDLMITKDKKHVILISETTIGQDGGYLLRQKEADEAVGWIVSVWDCDGHIINIIDAYESLPSRAFFVKHGKFICLASAGEGVQIWRNDNNRLEMLWEIEDADEDCISVEENHDYIAVLQSDKTIVLCDMETGNRMGGIAVDLEDDESLSCIALSPMGNYVAAGSNKGYLRIWDIKSFTLITSCKISFYHVHSITFSDEEEKVFAHSIEALQVWDTKTGRLIQTIDKHANSNDWNPLLMVLKKREILLSTSGGVALYDFPPLEELIEAAHDQLKNREFTNEERRGFYLE